METNDADAAPARPSTVYTDTIPASPPPAYSNTMASTIASVGQAPQEMTSKISELVRAGKYTEAQQLTAGLLIAYPDDRRLIKAKALIDQLLASVGSTSAVPVNSQSAQPAAIANSPQLTGMDKVDYNSLIVLARQAQQTTDLEEQKRLLKQFMDQSISFLRKHPEQIFLWQLRAASAISLNKPMAGYEAGQKLLDTGAADSNDPAMQQLLGQLRNKGWLNKQSAEAAEITAEDEAKQMKYDWVLGNWSLHYSWPPDKSMGDGSYFPDGRSGDVGCVFSRSGLVIEGRFIKDGIESEEVSIKGTILDSGELSWETISTDVDSYLLQRFTDRWHTAQSFQSSDKNRTMAIVVTAGKHNQVTGDWVFRKQ